MSEQSKIHSSRIGSIIVSGFFILIGFIALYDSTNYTDIDSKIFPQTVSIILIVCASIALARSLFSRSNNEGFGRGSWWRRILLVATMILACVAMPYTGFLIAAGIAFAGGLISAMHHRWSANKAMIYTGTGIIVMCLFYSLFRYLLLVPLP